MSAGTDEGAKATVAIKGDATIRAAMAKMTANHHSILPIIDDKGVLCGIVTDGDLRRGLLRDLGMEDCVASVVNRDPVVASDDDEEHVIDALMRRTGKVCVPVVDRHHRFVRMATLYRHPIPNCVPYLNGREQAYAAQAISGGWLAVGPFIQRFEQAIIDYTGAAHAVALSTGTAALHLSLLLAGVRPGDLVLMPSLTFAATANAVKYTGATPCFFDSEPLGWGINVDQLAGFLRDDCRREGDRTVDIASDAPVGAILPVHLYGHPVDMDPLIELATSFGIPIVEDGAEALGGLYKDRMVGSLSRLCVLSFNGNKVITGGCGGMILTDDKALADRARYLSAQAKDDPAEFIHGEVGFNYRLPNINAAIALAQAELLPDLVRRKREIAKSYAAHFAGRNGIGMWRSAPWAYSSDWMSILTVDPDLHPGAVSALRRFLPACGIEARPVWTPLHQQKPYRDAPRRPTPVADRIFASSLCLPCSVGLSDAELKTICSAIDSYFSNGGEGDGRLSSGGP